MQGFRAALQGVEIGDEVVYFVIREIGKGRHTSHRLPELEPDAFSRCRVFADRKYAVLEHTLEPRPDDRIDTERVVTKSALGRENGPAPLNAVRVRSHRRGHGPFCFHHNKERFPQRIGGKTNTDMRLDFWSAPSGK